MQEYLYGVVPREMPASWPAEALKAQAVAARTYSAYKKDYSRSQNYPFDICATTNCQAYFGYATKSSPTGSVRHYENSTTNAAVNATVGKVLLYSGKPILAEYSSSTGGYTSPGSVPYQKAVPDADDVVSPYHDWRGVMRVSDIEKKYPSIGRLVDIVVTKRNGYGDWGGRVLNVELRGTSGIAALSGNDFRGAFSGRGVRSTWFTVQIWRGELVSAPSSLSVVAGDTVTLIAQLKNTGNMSWALGGPARLITPAPSWFYGPGWISQNQAVSVSRNVTDPSSSKVAGAQVGEFRVPLSTEGVPPGVYTQTFKALAQGYSTMAPTFTTQIQVLPGWTDEAANLLSNPSFESGLGGWKTSGFSSGDGRSSAARRIGSYALRLAGGGSQSASQQVTFAGGKSRRFVLGAWNKTNGTSGTRGPVEVRAAVRYTDGSTASYPLSFARAAHAWTYDERFFDASASKSLSSITVSASLKDQTGEAFFDGIRLLESPVANPSFEDGLAGWRTAGFVSGDGQAQSSARDGFRSLTMTGGGAKSAVQYAPLPARKGERFVVSVWNRSVGTQSSGPAPELNVMLIYTDSSRSVSSLPFAAAAHDWTRKEFVVKAAKDLRSAAITLANANPSGSTFFDGVRVARTWTTNPSFEAGLAGWSPYGFRSGDGIVHANTVDGASALVLSGGGRQNARQRVTLSGGAGKRLVVSTWSRTVGTRSSGRVEIMLTFRNTDGTSTNVIVPLARSPHPWTYLERAVAAPKRFSAIDAYAIFYDQTGTAYFDVVQIRNA
jgi:SpoIID/LytB domain protein